MRPQAFRLGKINADTDGPPSSRWTPHLRLSGSSLDQMAVLSHLHRHRWRVPLRRASTMSSIAGSAQDTAPAADQAYVGVATRAVSLLIDGVVINVVAIMSGLGAELVLSLFPVKTGLAEILKPIAGAVYLVWGCLYFVVFWSWTGQTLGARVMQIRLLTEDGRGVKPARALVRWVGMNLAMIPLFAGFAPILVGRRGLPDWLARTVVLRLPQLSMAEVGRLALRPARIEEGGGSPAIAYQSDPSALVSGDDDGPPG
jgi:uncharacterized RDD family membrane protein YckC